MRDPSGHEGMNKTVGAEAKAHTLSIFSKESTRRGAQPLMTTGNSGKLGGPAGGKLPHARPVREASLWVLTADRNFRQRRLRLRWLLMRRAVGAWKTGVTIADATPGGERTGEQHTPCPGV